MAQNTASPTTTSVPCCCVPHAVLRPFPRYLTRETSGTSLALITRLRVSVHSLLLGRTCRHSVHNIAYSHQSGVTLRKARTLSFESVLLTSRHSDYFTLLSLVPWTHPTQHLGHS